MPANTSRGLKRVANASATSWDLSPISASAMKKRDCQNATMSSVLQIRAWAEVGYEKTLDPPGLVDRADREQDFGPKVWLGERCFSSAEPGSSPVCWLSPRPLPVR